MGVMNDTEILKAIDDKLLSIDPLAANDIQPASIDLHLHHIIEVPQLTEGPLDFGHTTNDSLKRLIREEDISNGYKLAPGQWVTGFSHELIKFTSQITGRIFNRNSLVRWGLNAALSSFINPGFKGRKVIVIHNFSNVSIVIRPQMRICQLEVEKLDTATMRSFEDRHNPFKFSGATPCKDKDSVKIDNPFSLFLDEQIKLAAGR